VTGVTGSTYIESPSTIIHPQTVQTVQTVTTTEPAVQAVLPTTVEETKIATRPTALTRRIGNQGCPWWLLLLVGLLSLVLIGALLYSCLSYFNDNDNDKSNITKEDGEKVNK